MDNTQIFCDKCGTNVENIQNLLSPEENINNDNLNKNINETDNINIKSVIDKIPTAQVTALANELLHGNRQKRFFVSGMLFIIYGLMMLTNTVQIGMWGMATSQNIFTLIDNKAITVIYVILYIVSAIMIAKPLFTKSKLTLYNVIPLGVSSVISVILVICVFIIGIGEADNYGADFSFTFTGWIMLISSIISSIISVRLIMDIKKETNI